MIVGGRGDWGKWDRGCRDTEGGWRKRGRYSVSGFRWAGAATSREVVRVGMGMRTNMTVGAAMRVAMVVSMIMSMMGVAKSSQTNDIDQKTEGADDEEFVQPPELMAFL
jgi:hypothetical protein